MLFAMLSIALGFAMRWRASLHPYDGLSTSLDVKKSFDVIGDEMRMLIGILLKLLIVSILSGAGPPTAAFPGCFDRLKLSIAPSRDLPCWSGWVKGTGIQ
jgi:hypothetical protein